MLTVTGAIILLWQLLDFFYLYDILVSACYREYFEWLKRFPKLPRSKARLQAFWCLRKGSSGTSKDEPRSRKAKQLTLCEQAGKGRTLKWLNLVICKSFHAAREVPRSLGRIVGCSCTQFHHAN